MASLQLRGVVKRFAAVEVIHGVDLDIVTVEPRRLAPGAAISDSFGFGGHNVVLVVKSA